MDASIIRIDCGSKSTCGVFPAERHGARGEIVTWQAVGTAASLWFPNAELFGVTEMDIPEGEKRTLITQEGVLDGQYPYVVFCRTCCNFAKGDGGTEPVIIIP